MLSLTTHNKRMLSDKPLATLVYDFSKGDAQLAGLGGNLRP